MKSIKNLISLGYLLMALLVIGIMYIWRKEWYELEKLEVQNRHIDTFRQESHEIFVFLIELSLSGETVLEWEYTDLEHYHYQRMAMDSMLCRFKTIYPAERIDSVRHLLEDKERQMRQIVQVFEQQQAINDTVSYTHLRAHETRHDRRLDRVRSSSINHFIYHNSPKY